MNPVTHAFAIAAAAIALIAVVEMLRRQRFRERHAFWWLLAAILALVISVFPSTLQFAATSVGVEIPSNLAFFMSLVILFFVMDGVMKLVAPVQVIETTAALGWPTDPGTLRLLGLLALVPAALYAWPRTAFLGALLLTAYLGGAVATHVRIASPLFSHILFGFYLGLMVWGGLWLRDRSLRSLLPFRR